MNLENELFDAFDEVVHQDYPNPQRIDCPGHLPCRNWRPNLRPSTAPPSWFTSDCVLPVSMN